MSTRATIIVTNSDGERKQFYHHTDGYPEYMGECLKSFLFTAQMVVGHREEDFEKKAEEMFFNFLDQESYFEREDLGAIHSDIEYMWFVKLSKWGVPDLISYTKYDYTEDKEHRIICDLAEFEGHIKYAEL